MTAGTYVLSGQAMMPFESSDVDIHGDLGAPMPTIRASIIGCGHRRSTVTSPRPLSRNRQRSPRIRRRHQLHDGRAGRTGCRKGQRKKCLGPAPAEQLRIARQPCCSPTARGRRAWGVRLLFRLHGHRPQRDGRSRWVRNRAESSRSMKTPSPKSAPTRSTSGTRSPPATGPTSLAATGFAGAGEHRRLATRTSTKPLQTGAATIVDAGGNQTAPPLFVDAGGGDYREAAGLADDRRRCRRPAVGSLDLGGKPAHARPGARHRRLSSSRTQRLPPPIARRRPIAAHRAEAVQGAGVRRRRSPATSKEQAAGRAPRSPTRCPVTGTVDFSVSGGPPGGWSAANA